MAQMRLVLAESDTQHRDALLMKLADAQPTPLICVENSGAHLLRTLRQCTVDAVIVSDSLPDYDVPAIIRDLSPQLLACPIIVIAHHEDQADAVRCFRRGVSDFVPIHEALEGGTLWSIVMHAVLTHRRRASERRCSERRQRALQQAADTDPMTGLFNRRHFRRCCDSRTWSSDRRKYLAVNLIDVDRFKQINDQLGHAAGDRAILAVADEIRHHCQPADMAFRWGGDEFLVLRYASDICESWIWAERLLAKVGRLRLEHQGRSLDTSLSIGLTLVRSRQFDERAIELADQCLYQAKRGGRNRVCTEDMCRAITAADRIRQHAGLDIEQRRIELLRVEDPHLGPVQRRHLTDHSRAAGQIGWLLARAMRLPDEQSLQVRRACLLHDIGKLAIPEVLLGKSAPLDSQEWAILSQVPQCTAQLAQHLNAPPHVLAVLNQLAHADTSAPDDYELRGWTGIARVADALASMLADRAYRPAMSFSDALAELANHRNFTSDSHILNAAHSIPRPVITRLSLAA